jgi:ABC-2 type transport system ATP-binding protein
MDAAIDVRALHKSYGSFEAVRGINLQVARGEVFALLGPNGAGKTTTVEILEGHRDKSSGEVSVLGHDPSRGEVAFKRRVGIVLQEPGVEPFLTVEEVIDLFRGYYPESRPLDEIIEVVGLQEKRHERVRRLSGGQQRRLDVAVGLAGDPELLFLDEPTTGFDPSARRNAWQMVKNLQDLGKTVFLTTHYMDEAEYLADRVAMIVGGKIVAHGAPSELAESQATGTTVSFRLPEDAPALPAELAGSFTSSNERMRATTTDPARLLHDLTAWALDGAVSLLSLNVSQPTLEDVFLELTGGNDSSGTQVEATEPTKTGRRGRARR